MVMQEPWKASAQEVYLLTTTDGSVPRGLDPKRGGGAEGVMKQNNSTKRNNESKTVIWVGAPSSIVILKTPLGTM